MDAFRRAGSPAASANGFESESVSTQLDGSFSFNRVAPGDYLVLVEYPGYIMDLGNLTDADLAQPSLSALAALSKLPNVIRVASAQSSANTIQIVRGAALFGKVRFDDGSPAVRALVQVVERQKNDKWISPAKGIGSQLDAAILTDDQGYYRVNGLRPGDYKIKASLTLTDETISSQQFMGPANAIVERSRVTLSAYYGDVFRMKDAKDVSVSEGQQTDGMDIVIALDKLHRLGVSLYDAATQSSVGCGTVVLNYADDGEEYLRNQLSPGGRANFLFVPEGDFFIVAQGLSARSELGKCNTSIFYSQKTMPIKIAGDVDNVNMYVSKKK